MKVRRIAKDGAHGAVGSIIGMMAMERVSQAMYELEPKSTRDEEESLREKPPYRAMAEKIASAAGWNLTEDEAKRAGMALHWLYGMSWGALYGVVRRRVPIASRALGLPFAITFSLTGDEGMNWAAGTAPPPGTLPWQAHVRGLVAHVTFVAVTEILCRAAEAGPSERA